MFAIISDIHSNIEALTAVLEDIDKRGIKTIHCLGDIVGYGPNPKECLDLVMAKTEVCIMGNHDHATLYEPTNFNTGAERAALWTRFELETEPDKELLDKRMHFLINLPMRHHMELKLDGSHAHLEFVHASPRKPIHEYVFPDDAFSSSPKLGLIFNRVHHICFIGHTHLPGVFLDDPDFYTADELDSVYPIIEDERAIINVGSVGQPRDGDTRASYAYVEGNEVHFVRVKYDMEKTIEKIYSIDGLDNFEADRLREGK
ncbi:phosphodiesterase [Limihaloglobus sulfuriphilus]|uniref:Phosphodiesterase n=1 Tax=Limihaloglobus sulfuriphilus TaxID=1851148 RepID=A0A1Q2MC95_9BACT|nr:metallophosphoesterase family protein [Limihaloglobus sulfuriphilus]AQQ70345.1 phosphodiesterase [Limihaloglobus sulfuriphilus]